MLLLGGVILSAEYYLRTHKEFSAKLLKKGDRFAGWEPSETLYLLPPVSGISKQYSDSGKLIEIRYDEMGFRIARKVPTQKNHILFLGDETTLATNLHAEQTFISIWQQKQDQHLKQFSLRSGRFINAAQPDGCPLLWLLQDSSRMSRTPVQFVICVITPQTFTNDFHVRRTVTFNNQGFPTNGNHPYAQPVESKQPTQFDRLLQSQLVKLSLPVLRKLFLGSDSTANKLASQSNLGTELINSAEREVLANLALKPLIELKKIVQSRGSDLIIVYLPNITELIKQQQQKRTTKEPPVILATETRQAILSDETWTYRNTVQNFAIKQQIRICDASNELLKEQEPAELFSGDGNRLSIKGHQKIAEILMDYFSARTADSQSNTKK